MQKSIMHQLPDKTEERLCRNAEPFLLSCILNLQHVQEDADEMQNASDQDTDMEYAMHPAVLGSGRI